MIIRLALAALFAVAGGVASASPANACSCMRWDDIREWIEPAELALVGTALGTDPRPVEAGELGRRFTTTFAVERASAETADRLAVAAPPGGDEGACGISFGAGERWLLTAYNEGGVLATSVCSATRMDELAPGEIGMVEDLLPFRPSPETTLPQGEWPRLLIPATVALVAASLAAALLLGGRVRGRDEP
jgi:hypothetical protein